MAELDQVVSGEWFEVRERIHHADQLFDLLVRRNEVELSPALWDAVGDDLERAIEGGIFEFKRRRLTLQLAKLEEAAYTSELFRDLDREQIDATTLLLVCAAQRSLVAGELRFLAHEEEQSAEKSIKSDSETDEPQATGDSGADGPTTAGGEDAAVNADIRRIVTDIQEIVAADPSLKMNAAIKNIMLQLSKYREEAATYQKLKDQASSYRLEMYSKTFSASFSRIFDSIRKNYRSFLTEQEELRKSSRGSVLDNIETKAWTRLLTQQIEEVSRVRATFLFVSKEHSGMREPLVALGKNKDAILSLIDREKDLAEDLAGGEDAGHRLGRILAVEVSRRLRMWARA